MDQVVKSTLSVDKVFFRKERDQFYGDWTIAFWRELFQNSVDAGSKRILIELNEVEARGSFGAVGNPDAKVTNVVFADDGHGMTAEVLGDVYFKMGKSTKDASDGNTIGGFGRARIMTCFSQERYTILTKDRFVMGDGVHFEHGSIGHQVVELEKYAADLERSDDPGAGASLKGLHADLAMLREPWVKRGGYPGCRVEVDLDATEPTSWRTRRGTIQNMRDALRAYLAESQLPCDVKINGQTPEEFYGITDGKLQARKGPVRRTLKIDTPDGEIAFATVHTSEGKKAALKGKLIIRVSGASMYKQDVTGLETQVIVEIDPPQSRNALNSNRDGLKGDYAKAVDKLIADLTIDTMTALKDKSAKVEQFDGEKGSITSKAPDIEAPIMRDVSFEDQDQILERMDRIPRVTSWEALHNVGLHQDIMNKFLQKTYYGEGLLYNYMIHNGERKDDLHVQLMKLRDDLYEAKRTPEWFFQNAGDLARNWVLSGLQMRIEELREERQKEQDSRVRGVHDIYIAMESTNQKTRAAARRHHPSNWDVRTGGGKAMRSLLSVWTAACNVSMESLFALRPAMSAVNWSTGFVYSLPEETSQGDQYRDVATGAQCVTLPSGDFRLLINPVNEDGTLRFSLASERDLRRILALAKHEVGHVLENYHNETFANIITDLDGEVDHKVAFKRMKAELAAVTAAYAKGRARVHSLDREAGPRPAERLLAGALGNDRQAAEQAMTYKGDGVYEVDTDGAYARLVEPEDENNNENTPRYSVG